MKRVAGALMAVLLVGAGVAFWLQRQGTTEQDRAAAPAMPAAAASAAPASAAAAVAYVDNQLCVECHADAAKQWRHSHHAMAMALPSAETVRGDFDNKSFVHRGVTTRFFRRDGKYIVNTDGPDGKLADFEIAYTFGVDPLQQYLIALPGGRLQPLTIAWDTGRRRWFHLYPKESAPPGDVLHWTGRYQTANTMCIGCHTTGYEKRYDAKADRFDSRWREINVSCQACHGPGDAHVAWARQQPRNAATLAASAASTATGARYGLAMDFAARDAKAEVEVCAACHSRRSELTAAPRAGEPLLDNFLPARLDAGLYHADGQQLGEVYAYGSFRQSRMYQLGVRCTDCHSAHTGKLKAEGNGVCVRCHGATADPRFPTAALDVDTPAHHHHEPGSAGAQCVACHMPSTNYMIVHARPDHGIRIPRPDRSAATGAPDACTACHRDRKPAWAADAIARWSGSQRRQDASFADAFAAARGGAPGADSALAQLAADLARPAIVRATALAALRAWPLGQEDARLKATRDADAEVRAAAADAFENVAAAQRLRALAPLLSDPVRAVRMSAARSLSTLDPGEFDTAQRAAFDRALSEYVEAQNVALDMPGARLNVAVIYQNTRQPELAEENYLAALRIDPDFTPGRANLAQFYSARGRPEDAERVLVEGLQRVPAQGDLQYSLGLVLAEQGRLPEAAAALARAAALLPQRARIRYNLGLALQQIGKRRDAERNFVEAQRIDPRDPAIPYALAVLLAQERRLKEALVAAQRLQELSPDDAQVRQFVEQLRMSGQRGQ